MGTRCFDSFRNMCNRPAPTLLARIDLCQDAPWSMTSRKNSLAYRPYRGSFRSTSMHARCRSCKTQELYPHVLWNSFDNAMPVNSKLRIVALYKGAEVNSCSDFSCFFFFFSLFFRGNAGLLFFVYPLPWCILFHVYVIRDSEYNVNQEEEGKSKFSESFQHGGLFRAVVPCELV